MALSGIAFGLLAFTWFD